jgi:Tol biopolymer transport system component
MTTRNSRRARIAAAALSAACAGLLAAGPAQATFPGKNGLIALSHFPGASNSNAANFEIATIGLDSPLTPLPAQNPRKDNWPDWSPDGSQLIWWHHAGGSNLDTYKMNANGTGQTNLTSENPGFDGNAAWSPDGQAIVLSSSYATTTGDAEIQVMDASGQTFRQLTAGGAGPGLPQFSPDGEKIAFCSDRTGHLAIYTMDADDGENQSQLTTDSLEACIPDWSPDGQEIVFSDNTCDTCPASDIQAIDVDSGSVRRLTNTPTENEFRASFSPNGTKIVFTSETVTDPDLFTTLPADIYVMNAQGTGVRNITNSPNFQDRAADWGSRAKGSGD